MKGYTVFNAEQVDGLPAHFYATVEPINQDIKPLDAVERFFANTKAIIQHGGSSAFLPATSCKCRSLKPSVMLNPTPPSLAMK
jgi:antirestriction protein ArdC